MRTHLSRRIVLLGSIVVVGCAIVPLTGVATDGSGQLSLADVVSRLLGLEKRVAALEERLTTLEQKAAAEQTVVVKPPNEPPQMPLIEIVSPKNGEQVGMNVIVEGIVRADNLAGRFPIVAVHPLLTNLLWVQPRPVRTEKTPEGHKFRCRVYCGTPRQGIGEKFELYALLPTEGALNEGDQLDGLPDGVPVSPSVLVTRTRD